LGESSSEDDSIRSLLTERVGEESKRIGGGDEVRYIGVAGSACVSWREVIPELGVISGQRFWSGSSRGEIDHAHFLSRELGDNPLPGIGTRGAMSKIGINEVTAVRVREMWRDKYDSRVCQATLDVLRCPLVFRIILV
jgi:hypothetical protein